MEEIIVLASHNKGKLREFQEILKPFGYTVKSVKDFGHTEEPVEDGKTYQENAYIKAKYYFDALKMPVIADDSGIEIEALGEHYPGIYSARFADQIKDNPSDGYEKVNAYKNGTHGFGYDPICKADEGGLYFGIVSEDEKNRISHRGKALEKLVAYLKEKEGN